MACPLASTACTWSCTTRPTSLLLDTKASDQTSSDSAEVAVGETVILLHPLLPSAGVSIGMEKERQQNDSLANGYVEAAR